MEVKVLKREKNEIELEFDDVTLPEILRVYLNKDSAVTFAAWKKEHATVRPVLLVKTKSKDAKLVVDSAVKTIVADLEKAETEFRSLK